MNLHGSIKIGNGQWDLNVPVVQFNEDNVEILYAPSLDCTGYGHNYEAAKESLKISVEEFFRYTHNKKTIDKVLLSLGWTRLKSTSKHKNFTSPENTDLISNNSLYSDIVNTKNYRSFSEALTLEL